MGIAELLSSASHANRSKVGAVIVKNKRIISYGYNGTPHGFNNECEYDNMTKAEVLHAESNAIAKCAMSNESTYGATIYITMMPCFECSKLIIQCGIIEVFYKNEYRDTNGVTLLKKAGVKVYDI